MDVAYYIRITYLNLMYILDLMTIQLSEISQKEVQKQRQSLGKMHSLAHLDMPATKKCTAEIGCSYDLLVHIPNVETNTCTSLCDAMLSASIHIHTIFF